MQIHQEFGSGRPTLLFSIRDQLPPLSSDASPAVRTRTAINEALSLSSLMELSSVYIPLSLPSLSPSLFPRLRVNPTSLFHTSAIAAAAIDCVTLPTRLAGEELGGSKPSLVVHAREYSATTEGPDTAPAPLPCESTCLGAVTLDQVQPSTPSLLTLIPDPSFLSQLNFVELKAGLKIGPVHLFAARLTMTACGGSLSGPTPTPKP